MIKLPSLAAAFLLATLTSASAVTDAEITPAALVGKTLTFTISTAGGAFANTGSWTGTFGATSFVVVNGTDGNTVGITTTHSTVLNGSTVVTLPEYIEGSGTTTITLFTDSGTGRYEMNFSPVDSAYQIGTFTIGAAVVKGPEIDIRQPKGSKLTDGVSGKNFGNVRVSKTGIVEKFIIKNTGTSPLKKLAITIDGRNKSDFIVSPLKKDQLAADDSIEFTVKFKPKNFGTRKAVLHIKSSDKDEASFDLKLTGNGTGIK
jgi:hypothetical protein